MRGLVYSVNVVPEESRFTFSNIVVGASENWTSEVSWHSAFSVKVPIRPKGTRCLMFLQRWAEKDDRKTPIGVQRLH
jgi:hypothetical protein